MSSSEGSGTAGEAAADPAGPGAAGFGQAADFGQEAVGAGETAGGREAQDPWFEPGPKVAAGDGPVSDGQGQAEWFLRTGRAGLMPDSMTVSWDDDGPDPQLRIETAGAPPWAGETGVVAGTPPPWESGPWPGPGEERPASGPVPDGAGRQPVSGSPEQQAPAGLWAPRTVLVTGLVPLVVPGIVLGALSLRRARAGGTGQLASWLAIGVSVIWAAVIVVVLGLGSGAPAAGCTGSPTAARHAYATAMADLSKNASAQVQAADLGQAATEANAAAAASQQPAVRNALVAMARDLQQARLDAAAGRSVPSSLRQSLAADGAALTGSCIG